MRGRLAVAGKLDLHNGVGGKPTHPLVSSNAADAAQDRGADNLEKPRYGFKQRRDLLIHDGPYHVRIGTVIVMDQNIPQAVHFALGNLRMRRAKPLSDFAGGFTDDLQIPARSVQQDRSRNVAQVAESGALEQFQTAISDV